MKKTYKEQEFGLESAFAKAEEPCSFALVCVRSPRKRIRRNTGVNESKLVKKTC